MNSYHQLLLLFVVYLTSVSSECPNFISRDEWGARAPLSTEPLTPPEPFVVVHHGGIAQYCTTETECAAIVRSYQDLHMDTNGWVDIGYNFVIGEDGNVYIGRGWDHVGAHAPGYNYESIGICVIGDFTNRLPNQAALNALNNLISCGVDLGYIATDYELLGHRQAKETECPGDTFFTYVQDMPHWTENPIP